MLEELVGSSALAKCQNEQEKIVLNCDKCQKKAVWRINATAPDGISQINQYACDEHKWQVHQELEDDIDIVSREIGLRCYGSVNDLTFQR